MRNEKKSMLFDGFVAAMRASKPDAPEELREHWLAILNYYKEQGHLKELGDLVEGNVTARDIRLINSMIDVPYHKQLPYKVLDNPKEFVKFILSSRKTIPERWELITEMIKMMFQKSWYYTEFNRTQYEFLHTFVKAYNTLSETESGQELLRQLDIAKKLQEEE